MRVGIREEENITIARFMSGLNLEIRVKVEFLPYRDLNVLVQLCIKVEQQNLRKESNRKENSYSSSYQKKDSKSDGVFSKDKNKEEPSKNLAKEKSKDVQTSHNCTRDI